MAVSTNNLLTWSDFSSICLDSIKSVCCNIDQFAADVPSRLRSGAGTTWVKSVTTSASGGNAGWGGAPYTYNWSIQPGNLITLVSSSTVNSEWTTFLNAAGITNRTNKLITAYDFTCAVGLYMQFMSFHIKPIYSRRQGYNTIEQQAVYQGCKYVSGALTPKYTLPEPHSASENSEIETIVNQNINPYELFRRYDNPSTTTHTLV